jgi:glucose/arabinose dehydrogenase
MWRRLRLLTTASIVLVVVGGVGAAVFLLDWERPAFFSTTVVEGTDGVGRDPLILIGLSIAEPTDHVRPSSLQSETVRLRPVAGGAPVPLDIRIADDGGSLEIRPTVPLEPATGYRLVLDGVRNEAGRTFTPLTVTFTTGDSVAARETDRGGFGFARIVVAEGPGFAGVAVDPAGERLYATTTEGVLMRWDIDPQTGRLSGEERYTGLIGDDPRGPNALIGLAFDPRDPSRLFVTVNQSPFDDPADDFSSRIALVELPADGALEDARHRIYIEGLPRSIRDHLSNALTFGPDGHLYLNQGGNSSMGAPDQAWGNRPERLLSASVLRIDPYRPLANAPYDVQTEDHAGDPGDYDPYAADAIATIYAYGLRNTYDMVWHSNGALYATGNGSAGGQNTPDDPATPRDESLVDVVEQPDHLFRVEEGGYYGHPNPAAGYYILNGGNPTAGVDPGEVVASGERLGYPVGIEPDPNWRGYAYDFGMHRSLNGIIEYRGDAFGGRLRGALLTVEFNGDRVIGLRPEPDGTVDGEFTVAQGLSLATDLVQHTDSDNLYVAEFSGRIVMLRPLGATAFEAAASES